ncbi:DNA polymerase III subunit delta [Pseudogemmobacter faecipullorum]|uniref:DNA-directed DNA polymerase n=1 Tax=Pseudogemmobacter faecipullorum TaxID=2755041 RepID=A0ABS8CHD8_9RHOB|nr:DNA polymerase III subunit delta [Pseudogemmobacter faecipullorum]MCB5408790.1 DNA polymerase III subunit delta [Pseudogemmobacter faecipullorum]
MLLRGVEARNYFAKPDPNRAGLLIFGADAMRVAMKRQEVILALIGREGEGEMRLSRLSGGDLRRDGAALSDAMRASGFFPGQRVAFVEDATDGLSDAIGAALKEWRAGDAVIVVTAGELKGKSALKTLFEKHPHAVCIGLYDDPPGRDEIEAELKKAGLTQISPEAMNDLNTLARALDPGDFRQTLEKISLYKWRDATPLSPAEVAALAPATIETEVDELLNAVAEGQGRQVGLLMQRISGQGVLPVTLCIQALRHFRSLYIAACDPGGASSGLMKARVFGPRRDRMQNQLRQWGVRTLEPAIADLVEADLTLRSSAGVPGLALMERVLLRIAMMRR